MNDVPWTIKFNTRNLRSPQYYLIVLVIIILQQILGTLSGYAYTLTLHQSGATSKLKQCVFLWLKHTRTYECCRLCLSECISKNYAWIFVVIRRKQFKLRDSYVLGYPHSNSIEMIIETTFNQMRKCTWKAFFQNIKSANTTCLYPTLIFD